MPVVFIHGVNVRKDAQYNSDLTGATTCCESAS